jgi:hypothetical protein
MAWHARTEQPIQHKNYKSFKPTLRREFRKKCVYCCAPDAGKTYSYGVDHYRPQSLFPDLTCNYNNLFYACNSCNSRKRAFWPQPIDKRAGRFIPNPCEHQMYKHLRYREGTVEPQSAAGRFAVALLDLNEPDSVKYRESVLMLLKATFAQRQIASNKRQLLINECASGHDIANDTNILQVENYIRRMDDALLLFTGG